MTPSSHRSGRAARLDERLPRPRGGDRSVAPEVPAVRFASVSKRYGRVLAVDDVSFDVPEGELFALLGPNGAGKTSLIHVLCTIHTADAGRAEIRGIDVAAHPRRAREQLGVVFQEPSLDGRLTVHENLDFHGRIFGVPRRLRRRRIAELLELVELGAWRDRLVRQLSGGMKRRLEIARSLVHDAKMLVLDEPTIGLDAQTRERIWTYLHALRRDRDLTILVTTHYIDEVESCDHVCIVDHGKVLALDTPERLKENLGMVVVRADPKDREAELAVRDAYGERVGTGAGGLVVEVGGDAEAERFVERFGTSVRTLTVERPSLETVFLSLTGRDLRDEMVGGQARASERAGEEPKR